MEDENIVSEIKYYDKEGYIKVNKSNLSTILNGLLPPVGEKTFFNKCYSRY